MINYMRCLHVYISSHKQALYFTKNHAICIIFLTSCVLKWISYLNMCSKLVNNTIDTKTTNICVLSYNYLFYMSQVDIGIQTTSEIHLVCNRA